MEFKKFKIKVQEQFSKIIKNSDHLFLTNVEKDDLWDKYLNSFPEGTNEIYRERRQHDCVACRQFIRKYGNVVSIEDGKLASIWDVGADYPYDVVAKEMSKLVKSANIKNVFFSKEANLGVNKNHQEGEDGKIITWEHFHCKLPKSMVKRTEESIESLQSPVRDSKNVFQRSMNELTLDAGRVILELIDQGSLYRGEESKNNINEFIKCKTLYEKLPRDEKDNWCWVTSKSSSIPRIKNTAIGTLLTDLSNDVDLDVAVTKFEKIMAPTNYKRPKAIFTKKMVEGAQNKIEELGYLDSLGRKFAKLDDITADNVLFLNRETDKKGSGSVFDELKEDIAINPKSFSKVEEVSIDDFINKIIPTAKSVELMIESKHKNSFMSLIAPENKEAATILKWNNNFSWSYIGDITDSDIRKNVKNAGGNVEGVLRFSIQWNDNRDNNNDFDAHCKEPRGNLIYYSNKRNTCTTGELDIDITQPMQQIPDGPAVENITWTDINKMEEGIYTFLVHNYSHNGGRNGFSAEIEYDGEIYSYGYDKELRQDEKIQVAKIKFSRSNGIEFINSLDSTSSSKKIWGVKSNRFVKVSSIMLSPNYWNNQNGNGRGNKHYFFFLSDCISESLPRGFYNEFLKDELITHKRVFEALGSKMRVPDSDVQLSGIGFSSTKRNSVIAKVEGNFNRTIKINI